MAEQLCLERGVPKEALESLREVVESKAVPGAQKRLLEHAVQAAADDAPVEQERIATVYALACQLVLHAPEVWSEALLGNALDTTIAQESDASRDADAAQNASSRLCSMGVDYFHAQLAQLSMGKQTWMQEAPAIYISSDGMRREILPIDGLPDRKCLHTFRVVAIANTSFQRKVQDLNLPEGDVLIHAGNLSFGEASSADAALLEKFSEDASGDQTHHSESSSMRKTLEDLGGCDLVDSLQLLSTVGTFQHRVLVLGEHDHILQQLGPERAKALCADFGLRCVYSHDPIEVLSLHSGQTITLRVSDGPVSAKEADIVVRQGSLAVTPCSDWKDQTNEHSASSHPSLSICRWPCTPSADFASDRSADLDVTHRGLSLVVSAACCGPWQEFHGVPIVIDRPCHAIPLLRFAPVAIRDDGAVKNGDASSSYKPELQAEGLALLKALPAPIRLVAFIGRGRSGKSTVCSMLSKREGDPAGFSCFPVGHSKDPVTEGIDIVAVPSGEDGSSIVYLDCEGCDNPFSRSTSTHRFVALVAFVLAQLLVHCEFGSLGESTLEALATTVIARSFLRTSGPGGTDVPAPKLCMLLMAPRFHVREEDVKQLLDTPSESRRAIKEAFSVAKLVSLPHLVDSTYQQQLDDFRAKVASELTTTLCSAGMFLSGKQVAEVLERLCVEMAEWASPLINAEGIYAGVVRARLDEIAAKALEIYSERQNAESVTEEQVTAMQVFERNCEAALTYFDTEAADIQSPLRDEVRNRLVARLRLPEVEVRRGQDQLAWAVAKTVRDTLLQQQSSVGGSFESLQAWAVRYLQDQVAGGNAESGKARQAQVWLRTELAASMVGSATEKSSGRQRRFVFAAVACALVGIWTSRSADLSRFPSFGPAGLADVASSFSQSTTPLAAVTEIPPHSESSWSGRGQKTTESESQSSQSSSSAGAASSSPGARIPEDKVQHDGGRPDPAEEWGSGFLMDLRKRTWQACAPTVMYVSENARRMLHGAWSRVRRLPTPVLVLGASVATALVAVMYALRMH